MRTRIYHSACAHEKANNSTAIKDIILNILSSQGKGSYTLQMTFMFLHELLSSSDDKGDNEVISRKVIQRIYLEHTSYNFRRERRGSCQYNGFILMSKFQIQTQSCWCFSVLHYFHSCQKRSLCFNAVTGVMFIYDCPDKFTLLLPLLLLFMIFFFFAGLFPAVLNLATNALITTNATCGEKGREMYCKLVEHVPGQPARNPQCRICDQRSRVAHRTFATFNLFL